MSRLSAVIGKPVLNIATTCIIGKVTDVYFDENLKKAVYFCIEIFPENKPMLLEYTEAQSILDAVVVADDVKLTSIQDADVTALRTSVMGMPVYAPNGADKGKIKDIIITLAGKITKLQTTTSEFTPSAIISVGNVILQKGAVKSKTKKTVIPRPAEERPVYILNDAKKVLEIEKTILDGSMPIPMPPKQETEKEPVLSNGAFEMLLEGSRAYSYDDDARTPTRVICDYEFLLGRTLGADLCTYTGELIAKQNSTVTDAIVDKARRAGKLVELTLNSIKPEK
ncbi:MAG: hypothetical protein HFE29_01915 [Clostridia bacterium]|jgi:sporulation protein YlmC with PRC-barrel domain|nr:hypothetical protein [Clostridia bacterium]